MTVVESPDAVAVTAALAPEPTVRRRPGWLGHITLSLSIAWVVLIVFVAIAADWLPLNRYDIINTDFRPRTGPGFRWPEPFGTDVLGRSMTSRLAFGARQSLIVALGATSLALVSGLLIGMAAGYLRGKFDAAVGVVIDVVLSIPSLILLLAAGAVGRRDMTTLVVSLGIIGTPMFARLARANTLALADREFVTAARAMGAKHSRIVFREILPNLLLPISTYAFLFIGLVMVAEGSLSFLGLGIPPPKPSWGGMINDGRPYLDSKRYLVMVPSACLVFTVMAFTTIGDWARGRFASRESSLA